MSKDKTFISELKAMRQKKAALACISATRAAVRLRSDPVMDAPGHGCRQGRFETEKDVKQLDKGRKIPAEFEKRWQTAVKIAKIQHIWQLPDD